MRLPNYRLEMAVFICGAVVMIFELVGSRILGPYLGTSLFVWTSLIGIILGSLSLGYYLGGKLADREPRLSVLSLIIFLAAILISLVGVSKNFYLSWLQEYVHIVKFSSVLASLILFAPASFLLGMVSPYAAKLKLESLANTGATVGNLYALSTAGSITGTFLGGFYLIPHWGTNRTIFFLSVILTSLSLLLWAKELKKIKQIVLIFFICGGVALNYWQNLASKHGFIDIDTAYNRVWVYDYFDIKTGREARLMGINNENHSAMFLNSPELVNEYTKYYHLMRHFSPSFNTVLMLGGGGYSFPKDYLRTYSQAFIDVVEIDPKVTEIARRYFRLEPNPRLQIYHQDARVYLNNTEKKYDVIIGDAFNSYYSIPYQLTTQEAVQKMYDVLSPGGSVILNIISSIKGETGQFLRAEYATYKSVFPQVYLFPVSDSQDGESVQNIILVALKYSQRPNLSSSDPKLNQFLKHLWQEDILLDKPILTDDRAPVDYYISYLL